MTLCSFSPSEIRVFARRDGTARKKRIHTRLAEIKMSRNPLRTCPFDGTRDTPGAETLPAGKPAGGFRRQNDTGNVFGKKFQRERKTSPEPPRKRFCTGIFSYEPRKKIPSPEILFSGLGISRSGPEFSRQAVQKVKDADKILHKSPVLCKKIARKSAIWAGLRKSRVTKISRNGTNCLFLQEFYDTLIISPPPLICCDGFEIMSGRKNPICCDELEIRRNLRCGDLPRTVKPSNDA